MNLQFFSLLYFSCSYNLKIKFGLVKGEVFLGKDPF